MDSTQNAGKRPYLDKVDRKRTLLVKSAALVDSMGWSALNMSSLAEYAQVSRQLIYKHFANNEALLMETSQIIFVDVLSSTAAAIEAHNNDLHEAVLHACLVSLDLPPGRGNALWQLVAGMNNGSKEFELIRLRIREFIIGLWLPTLLKNKKLDEVTASSLIWMLVMAFWGLRQLILDRVVTREQGLEEFKRIIKLAL